MTRTNGRNSDNRLRAVLTAVPVVVAMATSVTAACSSASTPQRPATAARLQITSPAANQVTGPDTTLEMNLTGARVVAASSGPLHPDEGHIHVSLDAKLVSMAYGTAQVLHGLTPGTHALQAEFVATDHAPFRNRVVAAVLFQVQPAPGAQTGP